MSRSTSELINLPTNWVVSFDSSTIRGTLGFGSNNSLQTIGFIRAVPSVSARIKNSPSTSSELRHSNVLFWKKRSVLISDINEYTLWMFMQLRTNAPIFWHCGIYSSELTFCPEDGSAVLKIKHCAASLLSLLYVIVTNDIIIFDLQNVIARYKN